jgi:flavin-dependent dehydrogenase
VYDVAVIGGGPAGAAAALRLAASGMQVALVERESPPRVRAGESVGVGVRGQLESLGLAALWDDPRHRPALERASAWADETLAWVPAMIQQVHGAGRTLDRNAFDADLLAAAYAAGATPIADTLVRAVRQPDHWQTTLRGGQLRTRWLVDAGGTQSVLARQLGLVREQADPLFALLALLDPLPDTPTRLDALEAGHALLIEAIPHGWWYSAPLADGRIIAVLLSDAAGLRGGRAHAWSRARALAPHTHARLDACLAATRSYVRAAGPALLGATRPHHVALGDALRRGDPLAGRGIEEALDSAARGVAALLASEAGDGQALADFVEHARARHREHLATRRRLYAAVRRFADQPFWRGRA